jgi:hypothetical protein
MNSGEMNKSHITTKIAFVLDIIILGKIVEHLHLVNRYMLEPLHVIIGIIALVLSIIGCVKQKTKSAIMVIILTVIILSWRIIFSLVYALMFGIAYVF